MLGAAPNAAYAQAESGAGKTGGIKTLPPVTAEYRDTPVREALEQLFKNAKVDYAIDPRVTGFVTLRITEQPFENALKIVMRSATLPLTYTLENGVFLVTPRVVITSAAPSAPVTAPQPAEVVSAISSNHFELIQLNYIDPYDLKDLLKLTFIPVFARGNGGNRGGVGAGGGNNGGVIGGIAGGSGSGSGGIGGVGAGGNGILLGGGNGTSGGRSLP